MKKDFHMTGLFNSLANTRFEAKWFDFMYQKVLSSKKSISIATNFLFLGMNSATFSLLILFHSLERAQD